MGDVAEESSYPTPYSNSPLLPLLLISLAVQQNAPKTVTSFKKEYDYIIIGAGSAGSTLAGRLSEDSCVNVLLLEAGKSPPRLTDIPVLARFFIGTDIDWAYLTAPQKHTGFGLMNNQLAFPSGKVVGGSSIWNGMVYVRGSKQIYNEWEAQGATNWSYSDVLYYFKKMEMNMDPQDIDIPYHGFHGPLTVTTPPFESDSKSALKDAFYELGYPPNDPNGKYQKGSYDYQSTTRFGQRCSTAKAYLVPAENRTNLDILANAFVTKILIEDQKAVGVQFNYAGKSYKVSAKKEVVVSAGTINTAQLLMLSGIGPKQDLEDMGIPVIMDLPVGENLQDHCGAMMGYYSNEGQTLVEEISDPKNVLLYIGTKTGILTTSEGLQYVAFLTDKSNTPPQTLPDYELYFFDASSLLAKFQINIKPEVYAQVFEPYENKSQLWCTSQILHPKSRGSVKLKSSDPYDSPIIDPNYFDQIEDLHDIVSGMKECNRIIGTNPVSAIGLLPFNTTYPGCEVYPHNSDDYLACHARSVVLTLSHQVGTAKMGDPDDPSTVVDPELRVKGIEGLRVVDASVMPIIPSGNTNVPTIMVAEKAADIIKKSITCSKIY